MNEKYPHNYVRAEVPDRMGQPFACRCGRYGLTEGVRGSGCTAAMRAEIDRLTQRVAELEAGSDIPRHLRLALANAQRAFEAHDRRAFGTINEDVQPVADAALAWIAKLEIDLTAARRTLSTLDCRYTGGGVADVSGSHCPLGAPCGRCQREARIEELERQLTAATAIVHTTTGVRP